MCPCVAVTLASIMFLGTPAMPALGTAQSFADVIEKGLGVTFAEFDQKWQAWINASAQP
jgi:hypothetical protein